jgi:putative iron-regulated protein
MSAAERTSPPAGTLNSCSGVQTFPTGPGNPDFEDFVDGKAPNADRRRQYLSVVTRRCWWTTSGLGESHRAPGGKTTTVQSLKVARQSLRKMFVALGSLSRGELGRTTGGGPGQPGPGRRAQLLSDNTHRDAVTSIKASRAMWLGRFARAPTAAWCKVEPARSW